MTAPQPPATVEELCIATGLSRPSVVKGIKAGQLPGYKVGNIWVIPRDAFDAFSRGEWRQSIKPTPITSLTDVTQRQSA